jgi:cytidylate kinase
VSRVGELRAALLERQRALAAAPGGIIMAGRDIGTVVLPDADLKVFLDASAEERARRRAEERGLAPDSPEARFILAQLRRRDDLDRNRPVAPLRPADDAVHIVTDGNRFEETVAAVAAAIRAAEERAALAAAATRP